MARTLPVIFLLWTCASTAQNLPVGVSERILHQTWPALWITSPDASGVDYEVLFFRRTVKLDSIPEKFVIHVSADNRYRLFVNGQPIGLGPAWSDLLHWRFETYDIQPYLRTGENVIAAQVVNFGALRPLSQHSYKTGFILQGDGERESIVNTDRENWEVKVDESRRPIAIDWRIFPYYYAAQPCDSFYVSSYPHGWQTGQDTASGWHTPACIGYCRHGTPRDGGHYFSDQSPWLLVPRPLPLLEESPQRFKEIEGSAPGWDPFISGEESITIPPFQSVSVLLDQEVHTRAYPELKFSGGKGTVITLEYAEALVDSAGNKGNRNKVDHKHMVGYYDVIMPDGGKNRLFRPLWHRVFRYVEVRIKTAAEALTLEDFHSVYTAYPYELKANFNSSHTSHQKIFYTAWQTLRNGTGEVFEDGPYYEQLMYAGDARVESLVSLYLSGDERPTLNAIQLFYQSLMPEGLTYSRYPSYQVQINPQYSLCWIQMIHDYWKLGSSPERVKPYLSGMKSVLQWHLDRQDSTGMLGEIPFLRHIEAKSNTPRHPERGHSAQQTLFLVYTLLKAAELLTYFGEEEIADDYLQQAEVMKSATYRLCFNPSRGLLADTPHQEVYTQHANTLGVLTYALPEAMHEEVMRRILNDATVLPSFLFFKFYVFEALQQTDLPNMFMEQVAHWEMLLDYGLTTFPEFQVESRSDCHAWSTHPAYYFLCFLAGLQSDGPGFKSVRIKPQPGNLTSMEAKIPHHEGTIFMSMEKNRRSWKVILILPEGLDANLEWKGRVFDLEVGKNQFELP